MSFTDSTFTVEVNGKPMIVLRAKWHDKAEEVCWAWSQIHWKQLSAQGSHGSELPPIVKLRIARASERAAYDTEDNKVEFYDDVKLVYLIELATSQ